MLQIRNLYYSIGELDLLKDVNWIINPGERAALIGPNGAGKTTLLRILNGDLEIQSGVILKPKNYRIGYLPQEEVVIEKGGVLSASLEGHTEILDIEAEMEDIHNELALSKNNQDSLLERLGFLEARYSMLGGYALESQAKKILAGLGFKESDFLRPISELSGGWRMRVYLTRLLLQEPDLLLLDEPTNHLDLESLEWIESYLKNFAGSMIIVSHDRFFLDRLAQEIAELFRGRLTHYAGNYRFYEKKKVLEQEQILKKWEEQREERQRLQKFIDRFRYKATKAAQVQSRIKRLEKLEIIEIPEKQKTIHFKIKADTQSYKEVLDIENMRFRYDRDWVLKDVRLQIYRGEKIALVGINGAGKTTLTRLISGELIPQAGRLSKGERVHVGYYAQHQIDTLNLNKTIYEEIAVSAAPSFQPKLRDILGVFQFSGDDINKRIEVLSGGEKARVSLAKILLSPCNFLIMDEPTNHLDLASKEALERALYDYDGTLLLISHDRYFLDKLVSRVIELKDGKLQEYIGDYTNYLNRREQAQEEVESNQKKLKSRGNDKKKALGFKKTKEQKQKEAKERHAVSKERKRLKDEIEQLENKTELLEKQKLDMEAQMSNPETYQNAELAARLKNEYDQILQDFTQLEAQWEEAQLQYEELLESLEAVKDG
jgi:ATP-binding cassette subfamily F protein 3